MHNKFNKVIFLDFDGVLNSRKWFREAPSYKYVHSHYARNYSYSAHNSFDPQAVARVNQITDRTGANIVVSSAWRIGYKKDFHGLTRLMQSVGIVAPVLDVTPDMTHRTSFRGLEIDLWLKEHHEVKRFAILDDRDDMLWLKPNLVHTTIEHGLHDHHVEKAVQILGEKEINIFDKIRQSRVPSFFKSFME